jgi:hypothetical protein
MLSSGQWHPSWADSDLIVMENMAWPDTGPMFPLSNQTLIGNMLRFHHITENNPNLGDRLGRPPE